jgi:two-component system, NarL family, nitrate/nitrite response regulator NarL
MIQNAKIRLAIVDDHQIVIDGLVAVLQQQDAVQICITANSGADMLALLQHTNVDILLSDVMMDAMNGQQLAKAVKQQFPHIKIIALSMSSSGEIVDEMINDSDIVGYLLKQTGKDELIEAIIKVYNGGQYFQQKILDELEKQSLIKKSISDAHLTLREKQIIALMEKDFSNKQIATELDIAIRTVETHRKNIFKKTNTNNLLTLVKWAYEHKILGAPNP